MQIQSPLICLNYSEGKWVENSSGETFVSRNPATGEVVAKAQKSNAADTDRVVQSAKRAFEDTDWKENPTIRAKALYKLAQKMRENIDRLSYLLTIENGKPLFESRIEVEISVDELEYFAGLARNVFGRSITLSPYTLGVIAREPMGVVSLISPWNWPLLLLERPLSPALAAGNSVVIKPASYTPASTAELVRLVDSIPEIPNGIVNFITGPGNTVGTTLVQHEDVDMVSFTGDNTTGKEVLKLSAGNFKKVTLELGGKAPAIIYPDADMSKAISAALLGAFISAGQNCIACTRLLLHKKIHDSFLDNLRKETERLKVGNGLEDGVQMGPVISESQMNRVLQLIDSGKKEARLVVGGRRLMEGDFSKGYFVAPTIFDAVPPDTEIAQEEIFGPVLSVMPFETEEEAVEIANGTRYGLGASVWTKDIDRAFRMAKRIKSGTVWINTFMNTYPQAEFGGYKQSGTGRIRGLGGLYEFTQLKHINIDSKPTYP